MRPLSFWKGTYARGFEIRLTRRWVFCFSLWDRPIGFGNKGWPWF